MSELKRVYIVYEIICDGDREFEYVDRVYGNKEGAFRRIREQVENICERFKKTGKLPTEMTYIIGRRPTDDEIRSGPVHIYTCGNEKVFLNCRCSVLWN